MDSPNIATRLGKHILLFLLILNSGFFFSHIVTTTDIYLTLPIASNERHCNPVQVLTAPTKSVTALNQIENENISLYSLDYILYDSDKDGLGDWVSIIFDPDLPEGIAGAIDCEVLLRTISNVTVANVSDSCYLIEDDYDEFTTSFKSISDYGYGNGSYYVQLLLYHQADPIPKCINNTEVFDLTEITITASFKSISVNVVDTFNDGIDDEIIVIFDPDLSTAIIGDILVEIYLVNVLTFDIWFINKTYSIFFNSSQTYEVSMGGAYPHGVYFFEFFVFYHSYVDHDASITSADFLFDKIPPTNPLTDPNSDPYPTIPLSSTEEPIPINPDEVILFFMGVTFVGLIFLSLIWRFL